MENVATFSKFLGRRKNFFPALSPTEAEFLAGELTGNLGSGGGAAGEVDLHDIAGGEGATAAGFYLAVNRNVTGLDEHPRLGAVLYQVR